MKSATFEVATIQDAIAKAGRVAPTKGAALDRAAGIVIDVDPARLTAPVIVMATDTEVTIRLEVSAVSLGDEAAVWRIPSKLARGLIGSMPIGTGSTVELRDTGNGYLYFKCKGTSARLLQITGGYPVIEPFEQNGMLDVPGLAARLAQVTWACDTKGEGVLSGIHMDGERLYACNRASMATVPCKVPLPAPITAPLTDVTQIIRNTGEVAIRATDRRLELMPDPYTQATCTLYEAPYPNVAAMVERASPAYSITLDVDALVGVIERTLVLASDDRKSATQITISEGQFKMEMRTDAGLVIDELEGNGGDEKSVTFGFNPEALRSAAQAANRTQIVLKYGPTHKDPILILDHSDPKQADYAALMMPIVVPGVNT